MFNFNFKSSNDNNALESLSPETIEDLDHDLYRVGYNIDIIENALMYLSNTISLNNAILDYANSNNSFEKNNSIGEILDAIK